MNEENLPLMYFNLLWLGFIAPADFSDLLHNHRNFPHKVKSRLS